MEENKVINTEDKKQDDKAAFDIQAIIRTLVLNWKWFLLSLVICIGSAAIYLRYTTPVYQAFAKLLIKEENNGRSRNIMSTSNLGMMSNTAGIDNEMEILSSLSIAEQTVRDLKLYTSYKSVGRINERILYLNQPINVDIDAVHLETLVAPITLTITKEDNRYIVRGTYYAAPDEDSTPEAFTINKAITKFPSYINTRAGLLTFTENRPYTLDASGELKVTIMTPKSASYKYAGSLSVSQPTKSASIAQLVIKDENTTRAKDYLRQLVNCYNLQANEDKNEIARRTERFINGRLQKINAELGDTEGQLEDYKKRNNMVELKMNASQAMANQDVYSQKLAEMNMQAAIFNSIDEYMRQPANKYQTLPANVGITDASTVSLINRYNEIVLERNRLLRSATESSPVITPLTAQLDDLASSIQRAMDQARNSMNIQISSVSRQYGKYAGQVSETPEQERAIRQIGRQQEVKAGLYLMLLQKREENSISLAATADKGKLIDAPMSGGKISPQNGMVMGIAIAAGLFLPTLIFVLISFFRYKIEGHEDVANLTDLPILADVAVASETAKTKADIVVHENKNNQMEEIFRSMRTNLQFTLHDGQKVIMFTSTTSGEGKTFNAANLAVSFALLDKRVILVGLDVRRPRLAELFEIDDHHHGITPLLIHENPTMAELKENILPSGINNNLDLLMAGPIPPNPTELIARKSLETIIDLLKKEYDYILIDTAPVGLVTDTLQIGRVADATIYMCRADYTPKSSFDLINSLAADKKLPNMSIVLNGIDMSKKKYGYYYGYGRYGHYGKYSYYGRKKKNGYSSYGGYGTYNYGSYGKSHYGDKNDTSIKR